MTEPLESRVERAIRDMRKKEYKATVSVSEIIREKADKEIPTGEVDIDGEKFWIDFKILLKIFGVGVLLLGAGLILLALWSPPSNAAEPIPTDKREASWACQRDAMRAAGGRVLPAAACYCRAKVGLPEAPACKADRTGRKGKAK